MVVMECSTINVAFNMEQMKYEIGEMKKYTQSNNPFNNCKVLTRNTIELYPTIFKILIGMDGDLH